MVVIYAIISALKWVIRIMFVGFGIGVNRSAMKNGTGTPQIITRTTAPVLAVANLNDTLSGLVTTQPVYASTAGTTNASHITRTWTVGGVTRPGSYALTQADIDAQGAIIMTDSVTDSVGTPARAFIAGTLTVDPGVNVATQGAVTFPFSGTPKTVGNSYDGAAYIVVGPGGSVTMNDPLPSVGFEGTDLINGVMVNPQFNSTLDGAARHYAFDERSGSHDGSKLAGFPQTLTAGDIIVKAISELGVTNARQGVIQEWAVCHIVETAPAANELSPSPWGWAGRGVPQWRAVDEAALLAAIPTFDTTGHDKPSDLAAFITRFDRFNPGLISSDSASTGGYQQFSLHNFGAEVYAGLTHSNYGQVIAGTVDMMALALMDNVTSAPDRARILRRMIQLGSWRFDTQEGYASPKDGDGGHWQFNSIPLMLGLHATGRDTRVSDLPTISPENPLAQSFIFTQALIDRFAPHSNANDPCSSRLRTVSAILGNTITIQGDLAGDPYHLNFFGLECRDAAGSLIGLNQTNASNLNASTFDVDLSTTAGLTVGDQIYFTAPYPINAGDAGWTIEETGKFNSFNPSSAATYRSLSGHTATALIAGALGEASTFDAVVKYIRLANASDRPTVGHVFPDSFGRVFRSAGDVDWVEDFYGAHGDTILGPEVVDRRVHAALGQSELEHILSDGAVYTGMTPPALVAENLELYYQKEGVNSDNAYRTAVTQANITAGLINPAFVVLSNFLAHNAPGQLWILADLAKSGTSFDQLVQDADTGTVVGTTRPWAGLTSVIDLLTANGQTVDCVHWWWYNSTAASIKTFWHDFSPGLVGQFLNGTTFPLGTQHTAAVRDPIVDHCLWDADAATGQLGRGVLPWGDTKLAIIGPMPFGATTPSSAPEFRNFTTHDSGSTNTGPIKQNDRGAWEAVTDFDSVPTVRDNILSHTIGGAHVVDFGGVTGQTHPNVSTEWGVMRMATTLGLSMLKAHGFTVEQPKITGYALHPTDPKAVIATVSLPNGGTLTTPASLDGIQDDTAMPHFQQVMGFELGRNAEADVNRRPVYSDASKPQPYRGSVTITDSGSGVGAARIGQVTITMVDDIANDDYVEYARGGRTAALLQPRDMEAWQWMLIENIPTMSQGGIGDFKGIAVEAMPPRHVVSGIIQPPLTGFASKTELMDAYVRGPAIGAGVGAMTMSVQATFGYGAGNRELFEITGGSLKVSADLRANKQSLQVLVRDAGNTYTFYNIPYPNGALPTAECELTISATLDDGTGTARLSVFVDGVLVGAENTTPSNASVLFHSGRYPEIARSAHALDLRRFRQWNAYTSSGNLTALGSPVHDIDGDETLWNNPPVGWTKLGTDPFT